MFLCKVNQRQAFGAKRRLYHYIIETPRKRSGLSLEKVAEPDHSKAKC